MKIKVDAVSKRGLLIDGNWHSWDRSFKPIEVRKGDVLDVEVNDAGFITKASLIEQESASKRVVREASVEYRQREILKGQCLKIASDFAVANGWNLEMPESRKRMFELGLTLFKEIEIKGYLKW